MALQRSRRLRLLESLRRTISDVLHRRVRETARARGRGIPENTSSIYTLAQAEAPDLLNQLFNVHQRVRQEEGEGVAFTSADQLDDVERLRMLSAVRASVSQTRARYRSGSSV